MKKVSTILSLALLPFFARSQFSYLWRQISGPVDVVIQHPDSAKTIVSELNLPGDYLFEFSVTNLFGTGRDTCKVTVLPGEVLSIDTSTRIVLQRPRVTKFEVQMLERASDVLVQIKSPRRQTVKVYLLNMYGQRLAEVSIPVSTGVTIASLPKPRVKGVYVFQFITYFENTSKKILIL